MVNLSSLQIINAAGDGHSGVVRRQDADVCCAVFTRTHVERRVIVVRLERPSNVDTTSYVVGKLERCHVRHHLVKSDLAHASKPEKNIGKALGMKHVSIDATPSKCSAKVHLPP